MKKRFQLLLATLTALVFLVSCSSDVQDNTETKPTFIVDPISVLTTSKISSSSTNEIRNGKINNYKVCVKDFEVTNAPVFSQAFEITTEKGFYQRTSDSKGCVYWSEQIEIEDIVSTGYYCSKITIKGVGDYQGTVDIPIAYDLEQSGSKGVVDLRVSSVPDCITAKDLKDNRSINGPTFKIDDVRMRAATSYRTDEELMTPWRYLDVDIDVYIKNPRTNRSIDKHKFKMVLSDTPDFNEWDSPEVKDVYPEAVGGKFITEASIKYKKYGPERFMKKYLIVKSTEAPYKGVVQVHEVYMDPWQWWGSFFFKDIRRYWDGVNEPVLPKVLSVEPIRPQILIQQLWLSYTGNVESYRIDKYMNLKVRKNYQILFRPFLNRKATFVPLDYRLYEKITIGDLKARLVLVRPKNGEVDLVLDRRDDLSTLDMAIERNDDSHDATGEMKGFSENTLEDYEYITGTETIISVKNGLATCNFSLDFDFTQTPFMVSRSLLLVEISPTDVDRNGNKLSDEERWDVDPILLAITMKAGEFWLTEGALFATHVAPTAGSQSIRRDADGNIIMSETTEGAVSSDDQKGSFGSDEKGMFSQTAMDQEKPIARMEHPSMNTANFGSASSTLGDGVRPQGEPVAYDKNPDDFPVRKEKVNEDDQHGYAEGNKLSSGIKLNVLPPHLAPRKERGKKWLKEPIEIFVESEQRAFENAPKDEFGIQPKFYNYSASELRKFAEEQELNERELEESYYSDDVSTYEKIEENRQRIVELRRDVARKSLNDLATNRKIFDLFYNDPAGIEFYKKQIKPRFFKKSLFEGEENKKELDRLAGETLYNMLYLFYDGDTRLPLLHATTGNPFENLRITPLSFLTDDPISTSIRKEGTGRDKFGINLNLSQGRAQARGTTSSLSVNFKFRDTLKLVPGISGIAAKFPADASVGKSWWKSESESDAQSGSEGTQYTLLSDYLKLGFKVTTRSCLLIEGVVVEDDYYATRQNRDRYMVCFQEDDPVRHLSEEWYFINTANTDSTHFVDYNNVANRNIIMPLRGRRQFVEFRNAAVQSVSNFIQLHKEEYEPLVRHALKGLFNVDAYGIPQFTDGKHPGMLQDGASLIPVEHEEE